MSKPLTIYTFVPQGGHASYYYRVGVPLQTAAEMGLAVTVQMDTNLEGIDPQLRIKNFCEADLVMMYQPIGEGTLHNFKLAKSFMPSRREAEWKYPPTMVIDTDDNLFRVDPHNGAFQNLGVSDPEGNRIPKGHSLSHVENGVRKVLWKDGENNFDVERNHATVETYRQLMATADCVTCTTPRLAGHMREHTLARQVQVFPNLVRFDHYPQVHLERDTSRVNILWQGGANHFMDWVPLKDAVGRITQKYPEVHWIIWGVQYPWAMELIPPHRMTFEPWCAYNEYKVRRMIMGDDISLAPLNNNPFNDSRSAIKWYEASVQHVPSATLAQNTGPYGDEIQDGETGLLFNTPQEFEDRLSLLIENREERLRLGQNAKQWISEHRDARKEVPKQIRFFEELRAEAPYEQPHMPDSAWDTFEKNLLAQQQAQQAAERQKELQPA